MMTRRAFLFGVVAGAVAGRASAPPQKYGRVTVSGWVAHLARTGKELHVFVGGEDVTHRCVAADDRRGYALLNRQDVNGRRYVDTRGKIAREIRKGVDVRIVEMEPEAGRPVNLVRRRRTTQGFEPMAPEI